MAPAEAAIIGAALAVVAACYASVGHAGASGYAAVFLFAGLASTASRTTGFVLNLLVAALAAWKFRAGFAWSQWWPLAAAALPASWWAARHEVSRETLAGMLGVGLWLAAIRIAAAPGTLAPTRTLAPGGAAALGAAVGLLAGWSGTGGGIFLTPILLLGRWQDPRGAAALSAPFIFAVSAASLAGALHEGHRPLPWWPWWLAAVGIGGWLGAELGARRFGGNTLRRLVAATLAVAGTELLLRAARLR